MNILAIDTATEVLSIALLSEGGKWYAEIDSGPRHSELIMDSIDNLFKLSGLNKGDLNLIACMEGPGSFTGLRIGFSTAKGLSMAHNIPMTAIPTLDCMAYSQSSFQGLILVLIDAKKACFFAAFYRGNKRLTDYLDIPTDNLLDKIKEIRVSPDEKIILTGPGSELFISGIQGDFSANNMHISPDFKRGRAWELLEISKSTKIEYRDGINSNPLYLRKSDAELKSG
ncbi:MAG: tRNA (adenosine(37)-N6)-threonylcarbamoyltransferase complex dimerization subunit type 1 TsaB [Treponema sp.]|nr:tRNA (adenosine(37)-N6)-threonylcarbamoyltransferase complex dimerization subunit type 1 TsaB [Treponema sp.]